MIQGIDGRVSGSHHTALEGSPDLDAVHLTLRDSKALPLDCLYFPPNKYISASQMLAPQTYRIEQVRPHHGFFNACRLGGKRPTCSTRHLDGSDVGVPYWTVPLVLTFLGPAYLHSRTAGVNADVNY